MITAASYPFLEILGTMLVVFFWVMWFWCLIVVLSDVYGRRDISGWAKAGWTVLCIFLPLLGVLVYLIAHGRDMAERRIDDAQAQQDRIDAHIRRVASDQDGAATEIAQAKQLLDSGAIDEREYAQLKQRVLTA